MQCIRHQQYKLSSKTKHIRASSWLGWPERRFRVCVVQNVTGSSPNPIRYFSSVTIDLLMYEFTLFLIPSISPYSKELFTSHLLISLGEHYLYRFYFVFDVEHVYERKQLNMFTFLLRNTWIKFGKQISSKKLKTLYSHIWNSLRHI